MFTVVTLMIIAALFAQPASSATSAAQAPKDIFIVNDQHVDKRSAVRALMDTDAKVLKCSEVTLDEDFRIVKKRDAIRGSRLYRDVK